MCKELQAKYVELCERNEIERVLKLGNNSDSEEYSSDGREESKNSEGSDISSDEEDLYYETSFITETEFKEQSS